MILELCLKKRNAIVAKCGPLEDMGQDALHLYSALRNSSMRHNDTECRDPYIAISHDYPDVVIL